MRVYEALADSMADQGVRVAFGLAGDDTVKLSAVLAARGVTYVSVRHEASAVAMASGYARVSGAVGVAIVSYGPGLTNAVTALVAASKARTPLLVVVGNAAIGALDPSLAALAPHEPKYVDQAGMMRTVGVRTHMLRSPASGPDDLRVLFEVARAGTTVLAIVPKDVMEARVPRNTDRSELERPAPPRAPASEQIAAVADLLGTSWAAKRPVILAGKGALAAGARTELDRLGVLIGSLMATSLLARAMFAGNEYDIGVVGDFSTPLASQLLGEADLVLAFGASLNQFTTYRNSIFRKARVVQIDSDATSIGRFLSVDLAVHADARLAATALVAELETRGHSATGYRTSDTREQIAAFRPVPPADRSLPGKIDPNRLMLALDGMLPRDRAVVIDGGQQFTYASAWLAAADAHACIQSGIEYIAIGLGLATAIGAALARPDRLTVLSTGDGSLMMDLGELHTAARLRVPLLVLVLNDFALGLEANMLQLFGISGETQRHENPSFAAVATAMGVEAATIGSLDELKKLSGRLNHLDGPYLIDCHINPDVRPHWMDFVFSELQAATLRDARPSPSARP